MGTVLLLVVLVFALAFARASLLRIKDITEIDIRWIQHVGTTDSDVFSLIQKYLYRLRVHRWVGAVAGAIMSFVLSRGLPSAAIKADSPWEDVFFCSLFGLLLCSMLAETNRVLPALLRGTDENWVPSTRIDTTFLQPLSWVLVLASVILAAMEQTGRTVALAALSVGAAVIYGIFLATIRGGHRPLMPLDLRHADDALRQYAARRFAWEALATAVLLAGWGWATTALSGRALGGVCLMLTLLLTLALVVQSRPYPSRAV